VATIDRYGLKKRHLHKHKAEVGRFFRALESRAYRSEVAEGYKKRLLKNEGKLFTFFDHDGVPWNNNNAEHAIKAFAYYRRVTDGQMREGGLSDYLVLLSLYQTCKYRGVSFLKFLLSREDDVAAFCRRRRKGRPRLEVYPEGFPPKYGKGPCECGEGDGNGRAGRVRWKPAILAFLCSRAEAGARRSEIADHCVGLVRDGTLATKAPVDDRPQLERIISMYLSAMNRAGDVLRQPGRIYFATARGLAWLERHADPTAEADTSPAQAANGSPPSAPR
jgi:hypothetical protein